MFGIAFLLIILAIVAFLLIKGKVITILQLLVFIGYGICILSFIFGWLFHSNDYHQAVDAVDECYTPVFIGTWHTFIWYYVLFIMAIFLLWKKKNKLPPIILALCFAFIVIGVGISIFLVIQFIGHNTEQWDMYKGNDSYPFLPLPIINIVLGIYFLNAAIDEQSMKVYHYRNKWLQTANAILYKKKNLSLGVVLLIFPLLIISALILILFGQPVDALVQGFTETTLWTFSKHIPPPPLDHRGHYLCTVAAKGNPRIVKPYAIGYRHGQPIIINRQLQIANAFEETISDISPVIHRIIRKFYDKYGYNLSRKINNTFLSSLTYILMKPLEWIFVLWLYLVCVHPEQKISKQYLQKMK